MSHSAAPLGAMAFGGIQSDIGGGEDGTFDPDASWFGPEPAMDWRGFDISLAHSHSAGTETDGPGSIWTERTWTNGAGAADDMNAPAMGDWTSMPDSLV
ncbi:hypothetical protein GMORB2_4613 [Geosmithia morbida]|uniref:Uncharacterized protein n=1 Tax=Geosmithia morbida TaxID=1094350 RepID=A0A9P5D2P5_9HYPO|nr:uncharacterized protein GMORB2_4613 [Geosmithia morbida]KAF4119704.1 hypothetical protein GMORB2_4613 [Geosmithia morbida]